ncbi:MAG: VCBS repeat-containing protein [Desulfovibrio sp.]|nr:VCBS repeat-containing protein [Desulfovibrio sp.]
MSLFRFRLAVFTLAAVLVHAVFPAWGGQERQSSANDSKKAFLFFSAPAQKAEATALLDEFLDESYANFRHSGGIPGSDALQVIAFEKDDEKHPLEKWPDVALRYSGNVLYLSDESGERRLAEVKSLKEWDRDWPLAIVEIADIDFDGQPDFFVLTGPAATGSCLYLLLDWDRKNLQGLPLFDPFPENKLPPAPDEYGERLFFDKGTVPLPNFVREKKMLEFISRGGPYYDSERWCFDGTQYYLCEKLRQSYYPSADNMCEIVRQIRFDRPGTVRNVTCRPIGDFAEKAELFFAAEISVPLYAKPGCTNSRAGTLEPGTIVRVLDYKMSTFGSDRPALWYKIKPPHGGKADWCCVTLKEPLFSHGCLLIGDSPKGRYKALGARRDKEGIELLLDNGSERIVLKGLPLVMRPLD